MKWYYSKNGAQQGPIDESELRAKLAAGEITPASLVWREGMTDWLPVHKVAELATVPATGGDAPYAAPASTEVASTEYAAPIPNYLWQSIAVTILCCWPFGIPAIVYSAKVDGLVARGDIAGAMAASRNARTWCLVAVIAFAAAIIIGFVMGGFGAWASRANAY